MNKPVLVIGGGIAGIQASLDLAEQGVEVYLVEKKPSIGGVMSQLDKTFPTLDCASCILSPKMAALARYKNIHLLTYHEVKEIKGNAGEFKVKIIRKPTYVDWDKCTGCGVCMAKCPKKVPDEFNMGLSPRKAIYIMFPQAVPRKAVIDSKNCLRLNPPRELLEKAKKPLCGVCSMVCPAKAIRYDDEPIELEIEVAAIIIATGAKLFDATKIPKYGYGKYANVYTHLEFERLISSTGPTGGEIIRKSDKKYPKRIAWIQCVGSRDKRFKSYCSSFCCMASTKQAILAKEHLHDVECCIFYMDIRAYGKGFEEFVKRAKEEFGIKFIRGKVVEIKEDPETKNLIIKYEDTEEGYLKKEEFDMVVLSLAIGPNNLDIVPIEYDENGFAKLKDPYLDPVSTTKEGIFVVGIVAGAKDIPDSVIEASAASTKAAELAKRVVEELPIPVVRDGGEEVE